MKTLDKGVISRIVDDVRSNTLDSILDIIGKEKTDEEREKLASNITIVDDDRMPYTDRFPVDLLCNCSGSVRRLNPAQLYEVEINFIAEEIRYKITQLNTMEEKEELIFKFLELVNEDQFNFFYNYYKNFDKSIESSGHRIILSNKKEKVKFIEDIEKHGFYLVKPPHIPLKYNTIKRIYEEFDFIKPLPIYINLFGTKKRRIMKDAVVGDKFIIILKQNNSKNSSARSTFRVNRANLPAKEESKKFNRSAYAKTPIRLSEIYNLMSSVSGKTIAEFNIFSRSSTLGRRSLMSILEADDNPLAVKRLKIKDTYINTNADILNSRLKAIGLRINFSGENQSDNNTDVLIPIYIGKNIIYDKAVRKPIYGRLIALYNKFFTISDTSNMSQEEKNNAAWDYVFNLKEVEQMGVDHDLKQSLYKVPIESQDTNNIIEGVESK